MKTVFRYDSSAVSQFERLGSGAIKVTGNLARTGVLAYALPGGGVRREYRPPEEVFKPSAMAFGDLPVTIMHPASKVVEPGTAKQLSHGHVSADVRQDSNYVAGSIVATTAEAIRGIELRELIELSAGYTCRLDMTSGISPEGEQFDCIQRDIVPNHVALLPKGMGRSGPEVSLRVDSADDQCIGAPAQSVQGALLNSAVMTPEQIAQLQARLDSLEAENRKLRTDCDRLSTDKTRLDGAVAGLQTTVAKKEQQVLDLVKNDAKRIDAGAVERVKVLEVAKGVVPELKCDSLGTDEVRVAIVKAVRPDITIDDKTDSKYLLGIFDGIAAGGASHPGLAKTRTAGLETHADDKDFPDTTVSFMAEMKQRADAANRAQYEPLQKTMNKVVRAR